ncbi:MAG: thiol:disulfide interchange protein DsbA/DsbL [Pseudomonadales bacterium]
MKLKTITVAVAAIAFSGWAAAAQFTAGKDYFETGLKGTATQGPVKVTEYFGYWCPHCNNFEPLLEKWIEETGDSIEFDRVPVAFSTRNPNQVFAQKAYYIGTQLKSEKAVDSAMFDFYHRYGRISGLFKDLDGIKSDPVACKLKVDEVVDTIAAKQAVDKVRLGTILNQEVCAADDRGWGLMALSKSSRGSIRSEETLKGIFDAAGVNTEKFDKYLNSFSLNSALKAGNKKADAVGIDSVPSIVVNGKYRVTSGAGFGRMLEVVEFLIEKENAESKK